MKLELIDRLQLLKRRRMLLREFMKYRLIHSTGTAFRATLDSDRQRRMNWWGIRQMYRTFERHYNSKVMLAKEKEQHLFQEWMKASDSALDAHVNWSKARIKYQKQYSILVGEGSAGIGLFMMGTVVQNGTSSSNALAKPPPSSIVRNIHYTNSEIARKQMDEALNKNQIKACELEQITIELEKAREQYKKMQEAKRRCSNRSIFAISVRMGSHIELNGILPEIDKDEKLKQGVIGEK